MGILSGILSLIISKYVFYQLQIVVFPVEASRRINDVRQDDCHFPDDTFSNSFFRMKIYKFR